MAGEKQWTASLVIPHPNESRLLLLPMEDGRWALPSWVTPDAGPKVARSTAFVSEARRRWGVELTPLYCWWNYENPDSDRPRGPVFVTDNLTPDWTPPEGARWFGREELQKVELAEPEHRAVLEKWLQEMHGETSSGRLYPWMSVRWARRAAAWTEAELERLGFTLLGKLDLWHEWEYSCVRRIATTDGHVYFKAAVPPFTHEAAVTRLLWERCPQSLPEVLAVSPEGWMLMREVPGARIHKLPPEQRPLDRVAAEYAHVQVAVSDEVERLAGLGCPTRRLETLAAEIAPAVEELRTMREAKPTALSPDQLAGLKRLVPELQAQCEELAGYRIPYSIDHGDFHIGNIFIGEGRLIYLDWSHSHLTHPFFSTRLLAEYLGPYSDDRPMDRLAWMREAYLEPWTAYEVPHRLCRAFEIAHRLAPVHQALIYHQQYWPFTQHKTWCAGLALWFWRMLLRPFGTSDPIH